MLQCFSHHCDISTGGIMVCRLDALQSLMAPQIMLGVDLSEQDMLQHPHHPPTPPVAPPPLILGHIGGQF